MNVNRMMLLSVLQRVEPGVSAKAAIEQSDCFVFSGDKVIGFNDEILAVATSPVRLDAVVKADDLMKMLAKLPDDELDVDRVGSDLVLKGAKRKAGLTCAEETVTPYETVPQPEHWRKIGDGILDMLKQASRVCGRDDTQYLTTVVHVTADRIESCDNTRLFRFSGKTGFKRDVLLPAASVDLICKQKPTEVSIGEGWAHFRVDKDVVYSVRCSTMEYLEGLDALLQMDGAEDVRLPNTLPSIVRRADVMNDSVFGARITIRIGEHQLTISARKEGGWYKERKKIQYSGRTLEFEANPDLICDVLERSTRTQISKSKMKVTYDNVEFVLALVEAVTEDE